MAGSINCSFLVYRIEKFLSKLCTVIFAQYLVSFLSLSSNTGTVKGITAHLMLNWEAPAPVGSPKEGSSWSWALVPSQLNWKRKEKDQNSIFVSLYLYMLSMALCYQLFSVLGLH